MDKYRYLRNRFYERAEMPLEYDTSITAVANRVCKSMSRRSGTTAHLAPWMDAICVFAVEHNFTDLIRDLKNKAQLFSRKYPKGSARFSIYLELTSAQNIEDAIVIANALISKMPHEKSFISGVARHSHLYYSYCGHFTNRIYQIYSSTKMFYREACQTCAKKALESGKFRADTSLGYNALVPKSACVPAINASGNEVWIHKLDEAYQYVQSRQRYEHVDYSPYNNLLTQYHESRRVGFTTIHSDWSKSNRRWFGCELEVEVINNAPLNTKVGQVHDALNPSGNVGEYCFFERDGSLNNGFEIITQPAGLDIHASKFKDMLNNFNVVKDLRSHIGGRCGFHVHVGRDTLTQGQILRIQSFLNSEDNKPLIKRIARRYDSGYCRAKPGLGKLSVKDNENFQRYELLNVTSSSTVEFRLFRGSLKYESIMAALEFTNALILFCSNATTSISDFTSEGFKRFVLLDSNSRDTKFLRSYLSIGNANARVQQPELVS